MSKLKRSIIIILLLSLLISVLPMISAQENQQQKKSQEVTEEFFYAEEEVEIAALKPQLIEEAPGIVSVITAQQIKDMGARELNDVLRMLPGFQLPIDARWYSSTYAVRGLQQLMNTRTLVMMDGIPLHEPYYGQSCMDWGDMSLNNVKRIEIIRGPGSALYGTYAFLAVINIITNKAEDINGVELSAGGGSWNTQHHYLLAGKKIGDLSISGYVDYRKSDGYDKYSIQSDLMTLLYSYVPFLPSASMAPGYVKVPLNCKKVDVRIGYKDFEFQFKAQDYYKGMPIISFSITDGWFQKNNHYIGQAIFRRKVGEKLFISLKGSYYYRKQHIYGQAYPSRVFGPLVPGLAMQGFFSNGLLGEAFMKQSYVGFKSLFNYAISDINALTFGLEFVNLSTDKPYVITNIHPLTRMQSNQMHELKGTEFGFMEKDADRDVIAAFMQDSWQISDKFNITAGLRMDYYSDFGSSVNPRISMVWKFLKNTNLKLLYGHAFRAPTFSELYAIHAGQVGNEDLGPEKVNSFEIGLNHKFNPNTNIRINYFYNHLTDVIMPSGKIVEETWPQQLENSGKVNAQGFEIEVKADFKENNYGYFNYSYAKAKDELTAEVIPNVANNLFNFGLNVGMWKYLNAHFNVKYVGERKRGLMMGFPDPRAPIDAYSWVDLTLRAQNLWKNTEIIFSIHNLLNTEYTDPEESGIIYYDLPREGRQILGKLIFKF